MSHFNEILSELIDVALQRQDRDFDSAIPDLSRLALFGAGNTGCEVLRRLRSLGVEPIAFIDDTPSKIGTEVEGIPVHSRLDASQTMGSDVTTIVTILNPNLPFLRARALLEAVGLQAQSFMRLSWRFPEAFSDLANVGSPTRVLASRDAILACQALWADAASRETFERQIAWRLSLDFSLLPAPSLDDIYFPDGLNLALSKEVVFLDAGAYDGDTLDRFLDVSKGLFGKAICIEPDPANYARLAKRVAATGLADRIDTLNCGIGATGGSFAFRTTGDMSAALDENGDQIVEIKALAEFLQSDRPVYAKFDIEGAEWETLAGTTGITPKQAPKLAVSVYHLPEDLWRIPLLLADWLPDRQLFLRAHGVDGTDVICYAI